MNLSRSSALFARNRRMIPGGMVSLNRKVEPEIAFVKGQGAHVWDADGNKYIDYHAAFAPIFLGHADPDVDGAVKKTLDEHTTLMGSGTTPWEGRFAELFLHCVPAFDSVQLTCSGSEATYHALRLARAFTGKDHVVVMQGGYNGWHDDVACNVMTPIERVGPRVSRGEYPFVPLSAGGAPGVAARVHVINFNDLETVEWAFNKYQVACLITEPILQNIGVVKPSPGYLEGLRHLCDQHGVVLVFDEVKTGFRHGLGGWTQISGVKPDLATYGKAIANGYPLGAIAGRPELMGLFDHPDAASRVLIAGTYNGHPVPVAAAIATLEKLIRDGKGIYSRLEEFGARMEAGLLALFREANVPATISRQGSAFCTYFMDLLPDCWHDIAKHHDAARDLRFRKGLINRGVYFFPQSAKQCSISAAHTQADVDKTLEAAREVVKAGI